MDGLLPPCASPLYIGMGEEAWPLLQAPRAGDQGVGRKSPPFLPHRSRSPLFRDLDLIPSGYDPIPYRRGLGAPGLGV